MTPHTLYRISAGLLAFGTMGHTFGGMLRTARRGPGVGAKGDRVFARMKAVRFTWRGKEGSWFDYWLGNGLGVSALLLPAIVTLWVLGGVDVARVPGLLAVAWTLVVSIALLGALGFRYFAPAIGTVFSLIAACAALATYLSARG